MTKTTKTTKTIPSFCPECESGELTSETLASGATRVTCDACDWQEDVPAPKAPKSRKPSAKSTVVAPATASVAAQLAAAQPQIAAKQAEKPARVAKTPDLKLVIVKQFKPRTDQLVDRKAEGKGNFAQQHNWDALVKAIQEHGGAISYVDAVAAVEAAGKAGGYEKTCNARGFVQGRVRNGHVKAA